MAREVLKTIWISDMSRFTLFTYEHGPKRVLREIRSMRKTIRDVLTACGGRVFKYEADNVFAVFNRPLSALKASLKILERLPPSQGVCIGIGHGPFLYIRSRST